LGNEKEEQSIPMQKRKSYYPAAFPVNVIEEAYSTFLSKLDGEKEVDSPDDMSVTVGSESWSFNTLEEFLAEYPKADSFRLDHICQGNRIIVESYSGPSVSVLVRFPSRPEIESVFQVFERNLKASTVVIDSAPIKIFIGHGRDPQWRDLKDHLHDQHGFEVVAYEIGPRAGLSVKEVLETMLNKTSFALLVLTGEDQHADGELHARENVIHELGLFQGNLGFTKAIALLEDGVKEFSNILGVNQIRFSKGNIRETFGDILATIKRESEQTGN
jgi:predicted nucleotide-binding protein